MQRVYDPIPASAPWLGHGRGMSQYHAQAWVEGEHQQSGFPQWGHYEQILAHYYTGIHIRDSSGNRLTPTHRWNPLIVNFGTPDNTPPIMCVGWPYTFTLTIQNSGTGNWGSSYKLSYRWRAGSTWINPPPGAGVSTGNVAPGDEVTLTLTITPLDTEYDTLVIDMRDGNGVFFEGREQGKPWYALAIALGGTGASAQVGAAAYSPEYSGHRVELCKAFLAVAMKNYPPPPPLVSGSSTGTLRLCMSAMKMVSTGGGHMAWAARWRWQMQPIPITKTLPGISLRKARCGRRWIAVSLSRRPFLIKEVAW